MTPLGTFDAGFAITPSDSVDFASGKVRGIYVGGTGDVVAVMGGQAITFKAVPVGTVLNIGATRVNATSTTATLLTGLY